MHCLSTAFFIVLEQYYSLNSAAPFMFNELNPVGSYSAASLAIMVKFFFSPSAQINYADTGYIRA